MKRPIALLHDCNRTRLARLDGAILVVAVVLELLDARARAGPLPHAAALHAVHQVLQRGRIRLHLLEEGVLRLDGGLKVGNRTCA